VEPGQLLRVPSGTDDRAAGPYRFGHDVLMLYAVIPAGGSGTRLWPLSRAGHPKFLHPLTGSTASLLQATVDRLAPLTTAERTLVVTGAAHVAAVARQLAGLPEENILVEPSPWTPVPRSRWAAAGRRVIRTR
jgi:mannose-1-phosphate guanylyltransferase